MFKSGTEQSPTELDFTEIIQGKVISLPAPIIPMDPYARKRAGTPVKRSIDYSYHPNGFVEFGDDYTVRRMQGGGSEATYGFNSSAPEKSVFLLGLFASRGALRSRLWFNASGEVVTKRYDTPPWSVANQGPGFSRQLEESEVADLKRIMLEPKADDIARIAAPSAVELEMLQASSALIAQIEAEFTAGMKALHDAERAGWRLINR